MNPVQTSQETLVHVLIEEIWNQKRLEKIPDVFSSKCLVHVGEKTEEGLDAIRQGIHHWQQAFPDLTHEIDQIFYSKEATTVVCHVTGTHLGTFMGIVPTKKKVRHSKIAVFKVTNGKLSEVWINIDMQNILSTLKTFSDKVYTEKDFVENFQGPAGKMYERVTEERPIPSCKQKIADALRAMFSTVPVDGKPELVIPPELFDKISVQEHFLPTRDGQVRALLYLPEGYQKRSLPMMVYIHGGGWTIESPESTDLVTRKLAHVSQTIVASVDYRLAPEHPYPYGLHDCVDAYKWLRENGKKAFNANQQRIAVGGDSCGGNLAPAVVIHVRNAGYRIPDACLMLCPATDFHFEKYPSFLRLAEKGLVYDYAFGCFVRSVYLKYDQWTLPEVSPMYDSLKDFCPTFVLIGGQDPLCDENLAFVNKMKQAGVDVEHLLHEEMPHGYYYYLGLTKEEDEAYQASSNFLRKHLS